jgi:hypothetical protein
VSFLPPFFPPFFRLRRFLPLASVDSSEVVTPNPIAASTLNP